MLKIKNKRGFIAYFVALIAIITGVVYFLVMTGNGQNDRYIRINRIGTEIASQGFLIKRVLQDCALLYPSGDNGTGFNAAYPAGAITTSISTLDCPGYPYTNKNIWNGVNGVFQPRDLTGWNVWTYTNDSTGIYIILSIGAGVEDSAYIMQRVAKEFAVSEVETDPTYIKIWIKK